MELCSTAIQYLKAKELLNDSQLREELRLRLNAAPGIEIPESKLGLRPTIPLELVTDTAANETLIDAVGYLVYRASQLGAIDPTDELSSAAT